MSTSIITTTSTTFNCCWCWRLLIITSRSNLLLWLLVLLLLVVMMVPIVPVKLVYSLVHMRHQRERGIYIQVGLLLLLSVLVDPLLDLVM
jgi:hypothetical protein